MDKWGTMEREGKDVENWMDEEERRENRLGSWT